MRLLKRVGLPALAVLVLVLGGLFLFEQSKFEPRAERKINAFLKSNPLESTPREIPPSNRAVGFLRLSEGLEVEWVAEVGNEMLYSVLSGQSPAVSPQDCLGLGGSNAVACITLNLNQAHLPDYVPMVLNTSEIGGYVDVYNLLLATSYLTSRTRVDAYRYLCGEVLQDMVGERPPSDICNWTYYVSSVRQCYLDANPSYAGALAYDVGSFDEVFCLRLALERDAQARSGSMALPLSNRDLEVGQ